MSLCPDQLQPNIRVWCGRSRPPANRRSTQASLSASSFPIGSRTACWPSPYFNHTSDPHTVNRGPAQSFSHPVSHDLSASQPGTSRRAFRGRFVRALREQGFGNRYRTLAGRFQAKSENSSVGRAGDCSLSVISRSLVQIRVFGYLLPVLLGTRVASLATFTF